MQQKTPKQPPKRKSQAAANRAEWRRLLKLNLFEKAAREQGYSVIAGIDEAGRGPLAGPVVAAACIIPKDVFVIGIDDSKKLTPQKRHYLYEQIVADKRITFGVGVVSHEEIDQINIYQATIKAMLLAVEKLQCVPDLLLIDGMVLPSQIPSQKIVGGDSKSHTIATASVIAKETRDRLMQEEHLKWPCYGFDKHKGYGTPEHLAALSLHGPCEIHRKSFKPCAPNEEISE